MDQKNLQNKIDNLDELVSKSQKQLAKLISKRQKQKQLAKEEPKKKLEKKSITKIVLDKQQQAKLAKYISKLEKEKQLIKAIKIKEKQQKSPQPQITKIETTTKKSYERFNVSIIDNNDPSIQLNKSKQLTNDFLIDELNKKRGIKNNITLIITFMKQEKTLVGRFKSKAREIINENDIETVISDAGNELHNRISDWIAEGSWCVIKSVDKHEIDVTKYKPLRGSSYLPLPEKIKNKKATINIENKNDNECFRWCHLAFLFPPKNQPKYKEHIDKVKYDKINSPVKLKDIPKIENMNDIRFNVFGVDDKQSIYTLYNSKKICNKTCNLLLIENGNENHYVWIKDLNKLMNAQSKDGHKLFFCEYCLQHFTSENILKNHTEVCLKINGTQKVKMPCKNKNIFFMNYHKQLMAPFVFLCRFSVYNCTNKRKTRKTNCHLSRA